MFTLMLFQHLHEGPIPKEREYRNFSSLFSGPPNSKHFTHFFSTHYVQNGSIYVTENPLALGKKAVKDLSAELPTSEIQTDQPSNIMIKCLLIFFKYQIFYT